MAALTPIEESEGVGDSDVRPAWAETAERDEASAAGKKRDRARVEPNALGHEHFVPPAL